MVFWLITHIKQARTSFNSDIQERIEKKSRTRSTLSNTNRRLGKQPYESSSTSFSFAPSSGGIIFSQKPYLLHPPHHHISKRKKKKHNPTAHPVIANLNASTEPRRSERERSATARFAQGWCALHLPSLSLALGLGAVLGWRKDHAATTTTITTTEVELPPNDDIACAALGLEACDEGQVLGVLDEEDRAFAWDGAMEDPRRSERERRATGRFEEGWFGWRLPRLASALGVAVTDRRVG